MKSKNYLSGYNQKNLPRLYYPENSDYVSRAVKNLNLYRGVTSAQRMPPGYLDNGTSNLVKVLLVGGIAATILASGCISSPVDNYPDSGQNLSPPQKYVDTGHNAPANENVSKDVMGNSSDTLKKESWEDAPKLTKMSLNEFLEIYEFPELENGYNIQNISAMGDDISKAYGQMNPSARKSGEDGIKLVTNMTETYLVVEDSSEGRKVIYYLRGDGIVPKKV